MKGTVEKLDLQELRDGRKYWRVTIDGQPYSLWDEECADGLAEGLRVHYKWRQSGNYRNLTEIEPENQYERRATDRKDELIVRMSCLKSATQILGDSELDSGQRRETALDLAREFEKYVKGEDQ